MCCSAPLSLKSLQKLPDLSCSLPSTPIPKLGIAVVYQRIVTLAFNSLEDFSKRFHRKVELNKTFWDVFTKMGMCACSPHSLYEKRITEPSRACSNFICRQNSPSQMRPTLAFRQDSAARSLSDSLPISPSQKSFCGNNYMSMNYVICQTRHFRSVFSRISPVLLRLLTTVINILTWQMLSRKFPSPLGNWETSHGAFTKQHDTGAPWHHWKSIKNGSCLNWVREVQLSKQEDVLNWGEDRRNGGN